MQEADAIVIGGQAVNIWAVHYRGKYPELLQYAPFTSKDIDFFSSGEAARLLAGALDGELLVPDPDDHSPNAALVVASLDGRRIEIDFMNTVLGVEDRAIRNNFVTLEALHDTRKIRVLLLHPLDCLRSRLANINTLKRHDTQSINQAKTALIVIRAFIDELLALGTPHTKKLACSILHDLFYIVRDECLGEAAHLRHGISPADVMRHFRGDIRLDERWRTLTLDPSIQRIEAKYIGYEERQKARALAKARHE